MAKDSFDAWRATSKADALDVLKLEEDIATLEARKTAIARKTFIIPGQRQKEVDEVQKNLGRLHLSLMTAKEHVAANAEQSAILEREREFRRKRKAEEDARTPEVLKRQKLAAEIAKASRDGLPETPGTLPQVKPAKPDPMADFHTKPNVEKEKIQAEMLVSPIPDKPAVFDRDEWLERRRQSIERKRKPKL